MASGRFIRAHDSRAEGFARPTTFFVFLPARERIVARDFLDVNRHWLAHYWSALVLRMFPDIARFNGRLLLLADGIKAPKSGRKMPAVKKLDQASDSNTKPPYIMGHSCHVKPFRCWRGAATGCSPCPWRRAFMRGSSLQSRPAHALRQAAGTRS